MTLFWFHYHFQIKENTKLLNIRNLLRPQLHQFLAHRIKKIRLYYIKTWSWDEKISIFNRWVYEILQIFKRVPKKKSVRNFLGPESPTVASKRSINDTGQFSSKPAQHAVYSFITSLLAPKKVRALRGAFHDLS